MESKTKFGIALGILVAGTTVGYIIGRDSSPDAKKPETARQYLVRYAKWKRRDEDKGELILRAGSQIYQYRTGDTAVRVDFIPADEIAAMPMPRRDYEGDTEKILSLAAASPAEAGILVALVGKNKASFSNPEKAVLIVLTVGSGVLGYYLGHESEPDCNNPAFENELKTNKTFWSDMEASFRRIYHAEVNELALRLYRESKTKEPQRQNAPEISKPPSGTSSSGETKTTSEEIEKRTMREFFKTFHPELKEQAVDDPFIRRVRDELAKQR